MGRRSTKRPYGAEHVDARRRPRDRRPALRVRRRRRVDGPAASAAPTASYRCPGCDQLVTAGHGARRRVARPTGCSARRSTTAGTGTPSCWQARAAPRTDAPMSRPMTDAARAPRLVATDLDGTLLRPDGTVSPRTAAALVRAADAGVEVVFVTARPPRWLRELAAHVAGHGVAICANGAAVLDVGTRTGARRARRWPPDAGRRHRGPRPRGAGAAGGGRTSPRRAPTGFAARARLPVQPPACRRAARSADRIEDVLDAVDVQAARPHRADRATRDVRRRARGASSATCAVVADSGAVGLGEISGPGVTKAATLADWAAARGIDPADVWAVGDAPERPVDARLGGHVVRRGQRARRRARGRRPRRARSNDDDGVADVLERSRRALAERRAVGSSR